MTNALQKFDSISCTFGGPSGCTSRRARDIETGSHGTVNVTRSCRHLQEVAAVRPEQRLVLRHHCSAGGACEARYVGAPLLVRRGVLALQPGRGVKMWGHRGATARSSECLLTPASAYAISGVTGECGHDLSYRQSRLSTMLQTLSAAAVTTPHHVRVLRGNDVHVDALAAVGGRHLLTQSHEFWIRRTRFGAARAGNHVCVVRRCLCLCNDPVARVSHRRAEPACSWCSTLHGP